MKKYLPLLLILFASLNANAKPTENEKQFCAALASYAFAIGVNRAHGVPKEHAFEVLVEQNQREPEEVIKAPIHRLIDAFYREDVVITDASELMLVVSGVNEECLSKF